MGDLMDVIIPVIQKFRRVPRDNTPLHSRSAIKIESRGLPGRARCREGHRKLAEFILTGIPPMPAGLPKVEISFILNADGGLKVRAKNCAVPWKSIEIKPQWID
jgi:molecular chaperone HscA